MEARLVRTQLWVMARILAVDLSSYRWQACGLQIETQDLLPLYFVSASTYFPSAYLTSCLSYLTSPLCKKMFIGPIVNLVVVPQVAMGKHCGPTIFSVWYPVLIIHPFWYLLTATPYLLSATFHYLSASSHYLPNSPHFHNVSISAAVGHKVTWFQDTKCTCWSCTAN